MNGNIQKEEGRWKMEEKLGFHRNKGFSLIELMLTVVFVMLGSQLIQGGFLRAADMFGRYSHTLKAMVWTNRELAHAQELLLYNELQSSASGTLQTPNKDFRWTQNMQIMETSGLESLQLKVSWMEGGKPINFEKEIYVYKPDAS